MGGQYVTAALTVTIVGWLLCEAVVKDSVDLPYRWFFTKIVMLFAYLKFLRSVWSCWALPSGVVFMLLGVVFMLLGV